MPKTAQAQSIAAITETFTARALERTAKVVNLPAPTLEQEADRYGALHAQFKALEDQLTALKKKFKASGRCTIEGSRYAVSIAFRDGAERIDCDAAKEHFGVETLRKLGILTQGNAQSVLTVKPR